MEASYCWTQNYKKQRIDVDSSFDFLLAYDNNNNNSNNNSEVYFDSYFTEQISKKPKVNMDIAAAASNNDDTTLTNLDLAFILDCTVSMDIYIDHAKENIHLIADEITKTENCNLRIGLIEFRDHPPQEYTFVTRVHNFTDNIELARKFISQCTTSGGGDVAESICCGLSDCLNKLEWRDDSVKLAILITDGPPHGLIGVFDDYFPRGCPTGNDPVVVAHKMAERAITLYCAGCEPSLTFYRPFFIPLTLITGGQYIPLDEADSLSNIIIGGSHEEIFMEKLMDQVNNEILKETGSKKEKPVDEEELTKRIHFVLNSNSNERKHKRSEQHHPYQNTPRQKFNEDMKKMSNLKTLCEFNHYIVENDVRISPTNFFIDVLDPLPFNLDNAFDDIPSTSNKRSSSSKRRKNNSNSSDKLNNDKRNSSPESSSSSDSRESNTNGSGSESNSALKANIDGSSNSSGNSLSNSHSNSNSNSSSSTSSNSSASQSTSSLSQSGSASGSSQVSLSSATSSNASSTRNITHMCQNINIDQARRLVKKALARNKLNRK